MEVPSHHPARAIVGSVNRYLEGHKILLGITASVSAYKSVDTARWLMRRGAIVMPAMTLEATKYVGPMLLHWATGIEPIVELSGETEHVGIVERASGVIVAPATLSTIAKIAHGIADTSVSMIALSAIGYKKRVMIVPAMHDNLYSLPQYERAASLLSEAGVLLMPPVMEEGVAKYPPPELVGRVAAAFISRGQDAKGLRVLVTAGPTREKIDDVRFITNASSGLMGVEIAIEAWSRGAEVDLVHGPLSVKVPHMVSSRRVESTEEMAEAVRELSSTKDYDIMIFAAAPADFAPAERREGKIRSGGEIELRLVSTRKVIEAVARRPKVLVTFAAEREIDAQRLAEVAQQKIARYGASFAIANPVGMPGSGFASETNRAVFVYPDGTYRDVGLIHKEVLARMIVDEAVARVKRQ